MARGGGREAAIDEGYSLFRRGMGQMHHRMRPAAERLHQPGAALDLLPAAPAPSDLSWASGDRVTEDAFARGCAAIDLSPHATALPETLTVSRLAFGWATIGE